MKQNYLIEAHSVHLWQAFVPELLPQLDELILLLNPEEIRRAERFKFAIHRERYIVARAHLRKILSLYLQTAPQALEFTKGPRGKPYLRHAPIQLQFNVSHSNEWVVYALTLNAEIGVDIEKITDDYNDGVAKRFFHPTEYAQLEQLSRADKNAAFYYFWAGKEAIIKALGEGLYAPVKEFVIDLHYNPQRMTVQQRQFYLENVVVDSAYQAAFAVEQDVERVVRWQWYATGPNLLKTIS